MTGSHVQHLQRDWTEAAFAREAWIDDDLQHVLAKSCDLACLRLEIEQFPCSDSPK